MVNATFRFRRAPQTNFVILGTSRVTKQILLFYMNVNNKLYNIKYIS